jgi:hypothetical protein
MQFAATCEALRTGPPPSDRWGVFRLWGEIRMVWVERI